MKRYLLSLLLTVSLALPLSGQTPGSEKITLAGSSLGNLHRVDAGVYRSDQPTAADFRLLEAYGIREVLNLRYWHSDKKKVKGTPLVLHEMRVNAFLFQKNSS